jgi:hypothetical protein
MPNNLVNMETRAGEAVSIRDRKIVPFAQALRIQLPKIPVSFTWNRPASVLVINQDGREEVLAIPDVTRRFQFLILGIGVVGSIIIYITFKLIGKSRS